LWYNSSLIAVSEAGMTSVQFIDKGTKVDASYYRETLLQHCLLQEICQNSSDHFIFQQDSVPLHRAVDYRVPAAYRAALHWIASVAPTAKTWTQLTMLYSGLCITACIIFQFLIGWSQAQNVHLLRESWPSDHWHIYWSLVWSIDMSFINSSIDE